MHLKRQKIPKSWPIQRKGTKYVVRPNFKIKDGVPVLVSLRDMLKLAKNRKEVKRIIHLKQVLLNDRVIKDEKNVLTLFDKINIVPSKEYYKLNLSKYRKFYFEEIKEPEAHHKISKIINKKVLKGKKIQLNLSDGRNYLSDLKCNTNDSVVIDFKDNKINKCLPLKEKAKVVVFAGKHSGSRGEVIKINLEEKMVELDVDNKRINALIKQIMVTE